MSQRSPYSEVLLNVVVLIRNIVIPTGAGAYATAEWNEPCF